MKNTNLTLKIYDFKLGIHAYLTGDFEQAIKYLSEPAKSGVSLAQYFLGSIYFDEEGVKNYTQPELYLLDRTISVLRLETFANAMLNKSAAFSNPTKAVEWFTYAAQSGFGPAQIALSICYQSGNGVERDLNKAFRWTLTAASHELGDSRKLVREQMLYYLTDGEMVDCTEVDSILLGQDNIVMDEYISQAQCNLGIYYIYGLDVERNTNEALKWLQKAAGNDYAPAIFVLGQLYDYGELGGENLALAFEYYMKSAKLGYSEAQYCVGSCYYRGEGIESSQDEAFAWWTLAANNGNVHAQQALGLCYYMGHGVVKNEIEAVKWFQLAADGGLAESKCMLAICYETGLVSGKGSLAAKALYEESANMGYNEAQYRLGLYYCKCNQIQEAVVWLRKAVAAGHVQAKICLERITNPNS